jgi:Protein of unknown function (DUF3617)
MKTIHSTVLLSTIALTFLAAPPLSAAERLHAGQWEFTSTTKGEATTFKRCITAEEARSVDGDAKSARAYAEKAAAGACKITDYKVGGDTISYAMTCGITTIRSTATYHGDTVEGDTFTKPGGGPEILSHSKGRRLGNCP